MRGRYRDAAARVLLRRCDRVGRRPVLRGTPDVSKFGGDIAIGDDFELESIPVVSHFFVAGSLRIGDRVRIGSGAAISCLHRVEIGDGVTMGAFAAVLDSNFHVAENLDAEAKPKPVRIEQGAFLGHRVVVLPGSTIGTCARVKAGSVVSGDVPAYSVVEGNPARVRVDAHPDGHGSARLVEDAPRFVMRVLNLPSVPGVDDGPDQIPQWDSLGALRLLLALEETFGISLTGDDLKMIRTVGQLGDHVLAARDRSAGVLPTRQRFPL